MEEKSPPSAPQPESFINWLTSTDSKIWPDEHDACAIVASVRKNGDATHGNVKRALAALSIMGHRSGEVNGEGDGCGVLTDIPRRLWAQALEQEGKPGWLAEDRRFFVAHLMIPNTEQDIPAVQAAILKVLQEASLDILLERPIQTRPQALGKMARNQAPVLWQIAGLVRTGPLEHVERILFDLSLLIESRFKVHAASFSSYVVVYKVRGAIETLYQYYPELRNPEFMSAITIGHARYSTNTATAFERVQPFSILGHNGEINTIARLREQAAMIGVELVRGGSDSQDVDRVLSTLIHHYHFSLTEAMEMIFPPIVSEVEKLSPELQTIYKYYRQAFGPFSQGPAGIISRFGDECVFSVDALGLRPLWFGDTEKEYFFSSEKGVYHLDTMRLDPIPLSPGEKMRLRIRRGQGVEVMDYAAIQQRMLNLTIRRFGSLSTLNHRMASTHPLFSGVSLNAPSLQDGLDTNPLSYPIIPIPVLDLEQQLAAFGWGREDREWLQYLGANGSEPLGSLGHDGPLPPLINDRQNIADYFKEAVAVVTNPAIDREREIEHFSTQVVVGSRPPLLPNGLSLSGNHLTLEMPLILDHIAGYPFLPEKFYQQLAAKTGCLTLSELLDKFPGKKSLRLQMATVPGETTEASLERLAKAAVTAVRNGANLILLDDSLAFENGQGWVDPMLALAVVDRTLRNTFDQPYSSDAPTPISVGSYGKINLSLVAAQQSVNLRRQAGLVVRSRAIRNLHDLILSIGLGADAVAPYLLFEVAMEDISRSQSTDEQSRRLSNTIKALRTGIEKCISTMGIHEMRGYGKLFASIGLSNRIARVLGTQNYGGSEEIGYGWENMDQDQIERMAIYIGESRAQLSRVNPPLSKNLENGWLAW